MTTEFHERTTVGYLDQISALKSELKDQEEYYRDKLRLQEPSKAIVERECARARIHERYLLSLAVEQPSLDESSQYQADGEEPFILTGEIAPVARQAGEPGLLGVDRAHAHKMVDLILNRIARRVIASTPSDNAKGDPNQQNSEVQGEAPTDGLLNAPGGYLSEEVVQAQIETDRARDSFDEDDFLEPEESQPIVDEEIDSSKEDSGLDEFPANRPAETSALVSKPPTPTPEEMQGGDE